MQRMEQENIRSTAAKAEFDTEMQRIKQANVKGAEELAAANKALDEQRVISQNLATELSTKTQLLNAVRKHGDHWLEKEANKVNDLQHKLDCLALTHRESLRVSEAREAEIARLNDSVDSLRDECSTLHQCMERMSEESNGELEVRVASLTEELKECRAARETLEAELATAQAAFSAKEKEINEKHDTLFSTHMRTLDELNEAKLSEESKDAVIAGLNLDVEELLNRGSDDGARERLAALESKLAESEQKRRELEVVSFSVEVCLSPLTCCVFAGIAQEG